MEFIKKLKSLLFKGAILLTISDAAIKGTFGLVNILIARFFGPFEYGQFATASSICNIFLLITGIGFEEEYTRRFGTDRELGHKTFSLLLICLLIVCVVSYISLIGFFHIKTFDPEIKLFSIIIGISLAIYRFQQPFRNYCLVQDKLSATAFIQTMLSLFILGATALIIYCRYTIFHILVAQLFLYCIFLLLWFIWLPNGALKINFKRYEIIKFFSDSIPFTFTNIIWVIYFNFDTFVLSLYRPSDEVGNYAIVYKIIAITFIFGYALANSFTPLLYNHFITDKQKYVRLTNKLLIQSLLLSLFSSMVLFFFSKQIISFLIGVSFLSSISVFKVLSISTFFRLMNFSLSEILTTSFKQRTRVYFESGMLVINAGLNLLTIPQYGLMGAAVSTLIAEILLSMSISTYIFSKRHL